MSSGADIERLWKLETQINKLVLDGKRDAGLVSDALQKILVQPQEKFTLLADLGVVIVSDGYVHATQLARFHQQNYKKFYSVNDDITDTNFQNPSRILRPGNKLRVVAYKHAAKRLISTSPERLAFLKVKNACFVGPQGLSLVFGQKSLLLPKDYWYASFDETHHTWRDPRTDFHRISILDAYSDTSFSFRLSSFENVWRGDDAFLCFTEVV